tara:strand:- start:340 stop:705 length:366 start_codon:yes stop_codon:yes gene_type:complete
MAIIHFDFIFSEVNTQLQIGDLACYVPISQQGAFQSSGNSNINIFGEIVGIDNETSTVTIAWDNAGGLSFPGVTDYIMFTKNSNVNKSSLTGYYADVTFKNNSPEYAELFSVSSQVSESSK